MSRASTPLNKKAATATRFTMRKIFTSIYILERTSSSDNVGFCKQK
jgi:hypothetical protein